MDLLDIMIARSGMDGGGGSAGNLTITKQSTPESGYFETYYLSKDGAVVGDKINIPKDYVLKNVELKSVTVVDNPYTGAAVGDPYIDFTINSMDNTGTASHIYLSMKDYAIKIDTANANGLEYGASGLKIGLASESTAGAMSAQDKKDLASAKTDISNVKDGTTKLPYIKNTGDTITGNYDFTGATMKVAKPVDDTNPATKAYVDGGINGIYKALVDGGNTTKLFRSFLGLSENKDKSKYEIIDEFAQILASARSDKTYTLRFYNSETSGDYNGTPMDDLADGREAAPLVTDTSERVEDWSIEDPMTWYIRANALSLADGTMNILAFEGEDEFDLTGETAPVYSFAIALYMKEWSDDQYLYKSWRTVYGDEYVPYRENVAPDGSFRNVTWHTSFGGGLNASGGMTSGVDKKPMVWTSSNDALPLAREITQYEGLWTDCDQQYVLSQWQLRHWTLENSGKLEGCTNYNYQCFLAAGEADVKRLLVTPEQGENFIVGSNVCLGNRGENENTDRNQSYNHDIFNCATITSIEDVSVAEISYKSLNIDIEEPITTTTEMFVSTIAWSSGTTEALQEHCDGCIGNLTNGKYPIRVAGIEMTNGAYINGTEPLWQASIVEDHWHYDVYSCRDSEKQAGSLTVDYVKTGEFDLPSAAEYTWHYITKLNASTDEAIIPMAFGGSSSTYYRSAFNSAGGSGGLRSPWRGGALSNGGNAGLACAGGGRGPSYSIWAGAPRLAGSGKKRGEFSLA